MTTEERFERIEHLTAGLAEERRKDREEYKILWRDTQRQINELSARILQIGDESREADSRLEARIGQLAEESRTAIQKLAEESRAANQRLEERIGSLVSAIGQFITKGQ
jgi:hypothetical protein